MVYVQALLFLPFRTSYHCGAICRMYDYKPSSHIQEYHKERTPWKQSLQVEGLLRWATRLGSQYSGTDSMYGCVLLEGILTTQTFNSCKDIWESQPLVSGVEYCLVELAKGGHRYGLQAMICQVAAAGKRPGRFWLW